MTSPFVRLGAALLTAGVLMSAGAAFAQTAKPSPDAKAPAAATQGAPPPTTINLVPGQQPWTKMCGKDPAGKDVCYVTRDFGTADSQQPILILAVFQSGAEDKRLARFLLPLGMSLKPGFRLIIEKGEPIEGKYSFCVPNGCFGDLELTSSQAASLRKANSATVLVRNMGNVELTLIAPTKGYSEAADGPALDPKQLEQQNAELQKQLEEKARQQRELLEKGQGVAPGIAPTPAPAK